MYDIHHFESFCSFVLKTAVLHVDRFELVETQA